MSKSVLTLGFCLATLSGCVSQTQWTPTVDTYGSSRAQFVTRDQQECRQLAMQVSGNSTGQAARGAVAGGLLGAAGGAAIGAATGSARTGSRDRRGGRRHRHGRRPGRAVEPGLPARVHPVHAQPRPQRARRESGEEGDAMTMTIRLVVMLVTLLGHRGHGRCRRRQARHDPAWGRRGERARLRCQGHGCVPAHAAPPITRVRLDQGDPVGSVPRGDIKVTLVDYQYIGHDDEFAIARVKMKTVGASRQHWLPGQRDRQRHAVPPGRGRPRLEAVERRRAGRRVRGVRAQVGVAAGASPVEAPADPPGYCGSIEDTMRSRPPGRH